MTYHMMLDLETLGDAFDAAIVQIGAVAFDPWDKAAPTRHIEITVDAHDAIVQGGSVSGNTLRWWMRQSEEARYRVFGGPQAEDGQGPTEYHYLGLKVGAALAMLVRFYDPAMNAWEQPYFSPSYAGTPRDPLYVACEGVWSMKQFDPVIFQSACLRNGVRVPWQFRQLFDLRTAKLFYPEVYDRGYNEVVMSNEIDGTGMVRHTALGDCYRQVNALQAVCAEIASLKKVRENVLGLLDSSNKGVDPEYRRMVED